MTDVPETNIPEINSMNGAAKTAASLQPELRNWCEAWKACLEKVLTQVSGQPTTFEISPLSLPVNGSDAWYTVAAGGSVHGEMTLRLAADSGTYLARKFLGEAVAAIARSAEDINAEIITSENREALEELLRQIAGLAATAVTAATGGEVQLHISASARPSWSSDAIVCFEARDQAGVSIIFEIQISPALAADLQSRMQAAPAPQTSPKSASLPPTLSPPSPSYHRLMDVGLDVKLRFGTRRMLLREVLALSAGVVLELDRGLHSPVDLLLDGRLVAQGEVVIVDGKYGLRVTDVVDPASPMLAK